MNFTSESVMHDIEVALRERSEEEWSNTDRLLLKAQLHIASLQRQLDHKDLTDEEILNVWISSNFVKFMEDGQINEIFFSKFARAILRKAKEK
jgi:hypothetical protein